MMCAIGGIQFLERREEGGKICFIWRQSRIDVFVHSLLHHCDCLSLNTNLPQLIISLCSILNWNNTFHLPFSIFIVSRLLLLYLPLFFPFPLFLPPPPLSLSVSNRASARFRRLIEFAWIAQNDIFSVAVASVYRAVVYLTPVASYATEIKIDTILIILCLISYMVPIYPCHRLISLYFGGSSLSN